MLKLLYLKNYKNMDDSIYNKLTLKAKTIFLGIVAFPILLLGGLSMVQSFPQKTSDGLLYSAIGLFGVWFILALVSIGIELKKQYSK